MVWIFLQRFFHTWRESWRQRRQLDGPARRDHELEFLPAAEALRDTPAHPAPSWLLGIILALALCALLWSLLGRMDVVAVAEGKVLAPGRSKPIQADTTAVVKAIHVQDGQRVKAGQILVELDASVTGAELRKLQDQLLNARLDQARAKRLLEALDRGGLPSAPDPAGVSADALAAWQARVRAQYEELQAGLARTQSTLAERDAEIAATRASLDSLRQSLPINREMAADYQRLLAGKFVARHAWLERERLVREQEQLLVSQQARLGQATAMRQQAVQQRDQFTAEARRTLLELAQDATLRVAALEEDLNKISQRDQLTRLRAPVEGTVQQLAVNASGAVVTAAQPVLLVVPSDAPVEVEAVLSNRDVGFVHAGQRVRMKVDSFDFTRFGLMPGEVVAVSQDAVSDAQRGWVYNVRIRLDPGARETGEPAMPLAPGMTVRAEIHIGSRRIIGYFLSPLQRRLDESLRER